ncbi:MAG: ferritin-like fold-containing protein [Actinomycetia bacterium]|nr:ferritin-like fold-containing protein [Actinomycetes bacterium]
MSDPHGTIGQGTEGLDPDYVAGAVDLLGVLAYEELTTYQSLAVHAFSAPDLAARVALCRYAADDFEHVRRLESRLAELGSSLEAAMEPFTAVIDDLNRRTRAQTWLEGLVKAAVADGIIADFYRELARLVDPRTREVVEAVVADDRKNAYLVEVVSRSVEPGSREASRLSLWGRRLVGEALTQAQQVAADREAMGGLLVGTIERPGADLGEIGAILRRVTERHADRMSRMGLTA